MNLAELVSSRHGQILARWSEKVSGTLHPAAMPRRELVDHLPVFLGEVAEALRLRESPDESRTAAQHGVQRLGLGFSLESVVREYGALREAIVEEAATAGVAMDTRERETVFECIVTGIADAVSEYQRQRDAELQRQMSEHFAFIAHELRNPLGTALTALAMLRDREKITDERLARYLERSLTRMHDLIDRTLRIAQTGSGIELRRERIGFRALLDEARTAAGADAEAKQVELTLHVESDQEISVDARLVHSALTNVVRNAIKFTHPGSRVEIRGTVSATRATVEVEDRCGGWRDGAIERAFAPFVQVGADRSGFGLGLAIAKQAADAHGGAIRVQNLPGKGCIMVLELPLVAGDGGG
jgi:signal transduction histidine kinase